jgi:hypothetical protein
MCKESGIKASVATRKLLIFQHFLRLAAWKKEEMDKSCGGVSVGDNLIDHVMQ